MNYATWKLNFINPEYGTGPEDKIVKLGFSAESAWVQGEAENGGIILGYVSEAQDVKKLSAWKFANITESEALDFCLAINPEAYLLDDGRIAAPIEKLEI
jgi:hypothetical protein